MLDAIPARAPATRGATRGWARWAWWLLALDGVTLALTGLWLALLGPHQIEPQEHYLFLYSRRSQAGRWVHNVHEAAAIVFLVLAVGLGVVVVRRASRRGLVVIASALLVATVGVAMWSARDLRWMTYKIDPSAQRYEDAQVRLGSGAGGTTSTTVVVSPGAGIPMVVPFGRGMPSRGIWEVAHDSRIARVVTLGGSLDRAEYRERTEAHLIAATICVLDAIALMLLVLRPRES